MKLLLVALLAASLALIGCAKEIPMEQLQRCEFSSDCIQVYTAGCCKCPTTINQDYEEYWEKLSKKKVSGCDSSACEMCGPKALGTDCINNTCTLLTSPVGINFP